MKGPSPVPGEDASQQNAVSVIPSSHTKPAEKRAPGEPGEHTVRAALAASNRAEASLSGLMRAVQTLSAGISGARESNVEIVRELEFLRQSLGRANEHQLALKSRLAALEAALEQAQHDSARERAYLADQHDAFIAGLIEDHEAVVDKLRQELEEARRPPSDETPSTDPLPTSTLGHAQLKEQFDAAQRSIEKLVGDRERTRETLLRLQAQRDEAQATVARLTRERDQGRSEMAQLKIQQGMEEAMREAAISERPGHSSSRPPAPTLSALKPSTRPLVSSNAPTVRPQASAASKAPTVRPMTSATAGTQRPLDSVASTRATAPMPLRPAQARPAAPPLDFKSSAPPSKPLSEKPASGPLKPKPDPSTRPLVGYSMTEASEERVDTSRITSPARPPKI